MKRITDIYVIIITCQRVLYEVYKHRARGQGAYKFHIAQAVCYK